MFDSLEEFEYLSDEFDYISQSQQKEDISYV